MKRANFARGPRNDYAGFRSPYHGGMMMSHTKPLTAWQRAAALATEGACLLPYVLIVLGGLIGLARPPLLMPTIPVGWQSVLLTAITALLYGAARAPLRLWRTAYYGRLCTADTALPSLRPVGRWGAAMLWRWQLWMRRAGILILACAPSALVLGYGSNIVPDTQNAALQPALWLAAGLIALLGGVGIAAIRQCRYALAPFLILRGCPAGAVMALSAHAMRGHLSEYINFLGGELPRLCLCLLIIPAVWILPDFRRRQAALLLSWIPPDR